jgi:uncharacterized membrane protein YcaP (DUF421 family)
MATSRPSAAHHEAMARVPVRAAALQLGEFAVGVVLSCAAVAATYSASHSIWPLVLVALVVATIAVTVEVRFGAKTTGLVVGLLPTVMLAAGLLVAVSLVVYRLN